MPPLPGESLLLTLFADIHYYFNAPTSRPVHHRLDKGSYVYLYHNSTQRRARLEVANAAGTPEQDAFDGYLDTVLVKNKFQQPALFSITVNPVPSSPPRQVHQSQWRLPAYDLRNEQKYLFNLHTLDIYFWTANDASRFNDQIKRLLPHNQLDLVASPAAAEHRDSMSPVVEKLEQAAIHVPPHAFTPSTAFTHPRSDTQLPNSSPKPASATVASQSAATQPGFAPYNPAAPAAPEPIAHREKTPPPPDGANGTGLGDAAIHDQAVQYTNAPQIVHHSSYQYSPQQHAFPGPPQRSSSINSVPPPPPSTMPPTTALPHAAAYHPSVSPLPALPLSPPPAQTTFSGPPQQVQTQHATYPQHQLSGFPSQSPGFTATHTGYPPNGQYTPLQSSALQQAGPLQSPGLPPPPSSGPPVGGYSNYTYTQQAQQPQLQEAYQVHAQLYRPTETEAHHHHAKPAQPAKPGALEGGLGKLEKGVGRFLRKLDGKT